MRLLLKKFLSSQKHIPYFCDEKRNSSTISKMCNLNEFVIISQHQSATMDPHKKKYDLTELSIYMRLTRLKTKKKEPPQINIMIHHLLVQVLSHWVLPVLASRPCKPEMINSVLLSSKISKSKILESRDVHTDNIMLCVTV